MPTKVSKTKDPERYYCNRSGQICTRELEEEALRNDWTIDSNRGGRRTASYESMMIRRAQ